jgi:hypothetical protein
MSVQTVEACTIPVDRGEFPGVLATLCSYEHCFGPYHPQTLFLMTQLAIAYWQAGEFECARPLLENRCEIWAATLGATTNHGFAQLPR